MADDEQQPISEEVAALRLRVEQLSEDNAALRYDLQLLHSFSDAIVMAIGDRSTWEVEALRIANKWREKNAALARELQLAQVGLTSGCGCPIGQCQKKNPDQGSCWFQWAESFVSRRQADRHIQELQTHGNHPSRFARARSEGKTVQRLRSPEPDPPAR